MKKTKDIKKKSDKIKHTKKNINNYIDAKLDKLSWKMGEKNYSYREEVHDR